MASRWGVSWGDAWGASWEIVAPAPTPAPTPAPAPAGGVGGFRFPIPALLVSRLAKQLIDEDELLMLMAKRIASAGLLTGRSDGKTH
jgi:hypothetical protein